MKAERLYLAFFRKKSFLKLKKQLLDGFFEENRLFTKNRFFHLWDLNFSSKAQQALEKKLFLKKMNNLLDQLPYALSNVKKYLKLALLSLKEVIGFCVTKCKIWGKK